MGTDLDAMREVAFKIKGDIDHSSADIAGLATNIFSVYFLLKKSLICQEGKSMTPGWEGYFSLLFLPATPSSPSWTLEGLFELTRRPSWALVSPRALLPELQRYKDTVMCAALGAEVPGHRQQQLTQTLIVRL